MNLYCNNSGFMSVRVMFKNFCCLRQETARVIWEIMIEVKL